MSDSVRAVVTGVMAEVLRETGGKGFLLHRPGTPEHDLVAGWAREEGWRVEVAGADGDERSGAAFPGGSPDTPSLLSTDPGNKLLLLLEGPLPGARFLPLGDLWPRAVRRRRGSATVSSWLGKAESGGADADSVSESLRLALEEGHGLSRLDQDLPPEFAHRVRAALARTALLFRPPVVPKLTDWSPGIDPGL